MEASPTRFLLASVALLVCCLSGCATAPREDAVILRDQTPLLTTHTDKDVETYIGCLNPKLVAIRPPVQLMRDGNAAILRITSLANPVLVVTVSPRSEGGSHVVLRARSPGAKGVSASIDAANGCR